MCSPVPIAILWLAAACGGSAAADEAPEPLPAGTSAATSVCGAAPLDEDSARAIRAILDAGFRARTPNLATLDQLVSSAGSEGERDSRVEYARGLVLLKLVKHREAEAAFLAAAEAGPPCLPAWQALIRTRLLLKEADAALEHAETLATRLADPNAAWPNEACRSEATAWLGRVAGFLALDGVDLLDPPALLTAHEARVRQVLDGPLLDAWTAGRESVHREHQSLLAERAKERTEIKQGQQERHEERQAEIRSQRAELDERAETLQMTAREWQAWLDEQLRRTEKQLTILQKDFATLDAAARSVSSEIAERQRELTAFQLQVGFGDRRRPSSLIANPVDVALIEHQGQIARLQTQFDALAAKAQAVAAQARAVLAKRVAAAQRFQRATGKLAQKDVTLQKWEKLLEKSTDRKEPKAAAETSKYRSLTTRLTLVATYFELDPNVERKRLLDEIDRAP